MALPCLKTFIVVDRADVPINVLLINLQTLSSLEEKVGTTSVLPPKVLILADPK